MRTVITGGSGFLGARLAAQLLAAPASPGDPPALRRIVLADRVAPAGHLVSGLPGVAEVGAGQIETVEVDLTGPTAALEELVTGADEVVHLASIVSADAEAGPDRAWELNVETSRRLLAACARRAQGCRFLTASSVAVFTNDLEVGACGDVTKARPRSTYGMTKAVLELLVNEATRRGEVDGRIARLPTVIVRPGRANLAASSFASGVFREPLAGIDCTVPVGKDVVLVVIGQRAAVAGLAGLLRVPAQQLGADRGVNLPGLCVTVAEMVAAVRQVGAARGLVLGNITVDPDPVVAAIVGSWPARWEASQGRRLGLPHDASLIAIVEQFLEDQAVQNG